MLSLPGFTLSLPDLSTAPAGIASIADADDEVGKSLSYAQFTKILEVFATGDNYKRT